MPAAENASDTAAVSVPTPVVPARGHSASASADTARCTATSDEEHAVSSVRHGPVSPSVYETRPEATEPSVGEARAPRGKRIEFGAGVRDMRASTIFAA